MRKKEEIYLVTTVQSIIIAVILMALIVEPVLKLLIFSGKVL